MNQANRYDRLKGIRNFLYRIEDILLIGLLVTMMVVAIFQIVLRNLFEAGIVWGDPLLRMLVLWVGLIGAMVATRFDNHIRIDLLNRYLPEHLKPTVKIVVGCFTAVTCGVFAYFGLQLVRFEFIDGNFAFAKVPVWFCASVIPFAFLIIALRSLASAIIQFTDSETPSP